VLDDYAIATIPTTRTASRTIVAVNEATGWRLALAERIGASYASDSNARVVMVAGSVGRGSADRYSDVEVDVYYSRPPTEAERIAAAERSGGTIERLDEDADEWEERLSFGGFHAHTSTFLVATMERYLHETVDECATAPEAQTRLFSLQHGKTLKGEEQVERWRGRPPPTRTAFNGPCSRRTSRSSASGMRPKCWPSVTIGLRSTSCLSRRVGGCSAHCSD
jgi:hypothetical protein